MSRLGIWKAFHKAPRRAQEVGYRCPFYGRLQRKIRKRLKGSNRFCGCRSVLKSGEFWKIQIPWRSISPVCGLLPRFHRKGREMNFACPYRLSPQGREGLRRAASNLERRGENLAAKGKPFFRWSLAGRFDNGYNLGLGFSIPWQRNGKEA